MKKIFFLVFLLSSCTSTNYKKNDIINDIDIYSDLTYEEYISSPSFNYNDSYTPPIVHVNHIFHKYELSKIPDNSDLKIYRKKTINKDNIFDKMK